MTTSKASRRAPPVAAAAGGGEKPPAVARGSATAKTPKTPMLIQHVLCGITGGSNRTETRSELVKLGFDTGGLIVDVSPAYLLQAGLPYSRSDIGIVLDADLTDVPEKYQVKRRADRLVSVLADAVPSSDGCSRNTKTI